NVVAASASSGNIDATGGATASSSASGESDDSATTTTGQGPTDSCPAYVPTIDGIFDPTGGSSSAQQASTTSAAVPTLQSHWELLFTDRASIAAGANPFDRGEFEDFELLHPLPFRVRKSPVVPHEPETAIYGEAWAASGAPVGSLFDLRFEFPQNLPSSLANVVSVEIFPAKGLFFFPKGMLEADRTCFSQFQQDPGLLEMQLKELLKSTTSVANRAALFGTGTTNDVKPLDVAARSAFFPFRADFCAQKHRTFPHGTALSGTALSPPFFAGTRVEKPSLRAPLAVDMKVKTRGGEEDAGASSSLGASGATAATSAAASGDVATASSSSTGLSWLADLLSRESADSGVVVPPCSTPDCLEVLNILQTTTGSSLEQLQAQILPKEWMWYVIASTRNKTNGVTKIIAWDRLANPVPLTRLPFGLKALWMPGALRADVTISL
ncbi:unnamed protein product, partial [Amoebophrya sp. A25]